MILVVWQDDYFPEFYEFDDKHYDELLPLHGHYVNSTDTPKEIVDSICNFFYDCEYKFKYYDKCLKGPLKDKHYSLVIMTGFLP